MAGTAGHRAEVRQVQVGRDRSRKGEGWAWFWFWGRSDMAWFMFSQHHCGFSVMNRLKRWRGVETGKPVRRPLWQVQAAWGWQRSGMTARWRKPQTWVVATGIRWKTRLWETPLKEEIQNVVTRKEVTEKTLRLGAWDLKIRGRMTALEPRWGLRMRDVDLSAQRDKWNQKMKSVSREYKKKGKTWVLGGPDRREISRREDSNRSEQGGTQKIRMVHGPWKRKGF